MRLKLVFHIRIEVFHVQVYLQHFIEWGNNVFKIGHPFKIKEYNQVQKFIFKEYCYLCQNFLSTK